MINTSSFVLSISSLISARFPLMLLALRVPILRLLRFSGDVVVESFSEVVSLSEDISGSLFLRKLLSLVTLGGLEVGEEAWLVELCLGVLK